MKREVEALQRQAYACHVMGSRLYGAILDRCAMGEDREAVLSLLSSRPDSEDLTEAAIPLRLLAAVHRLALSGRAQALAASYPSCGGDGSVEAAWSAFVSVVTDRYTTIKSELDQPLQTNEIARAAALLGGFLFVASRFKMPLRLLEIGASAGLMLRWDHFRYEARAWSWGRQDSVVRLAENFSDDALPFAMDLRVDVAERLGCDVAPIDPTTEEGRRRLVSFVWPDQTDRIGRLVAACELARTIEAPIEQANAPEWLQAQLRTTRCGVATVVFHSVVLQYMTVGDREQLGRVLANYAARATAESPLAYLSLEPHNYRGRVVLRIWPGDQRFDLAESSMHGRDVKWL
jgi:hypothetical protein